MTSSLPPSLARIQPASANHSPASSDDMAFPDINQHIDVEKEITQFKKDLDANEGHEEFVFRTKLPKSVTQHHDQDQQQQQQQQQHQDTSRDHWDGDANTPSATNNHNVRNVYYAFKQRPPAQKTHMQLAAHLERRESRYPSFLGSRSSVSMTGTSSAASFRTLQRSPSRRGSTEVLVYPSLSPQVMDVINNLEDHKKKAENDGNYAEAQAAAQRINGVKILEDNKRKSAMIDRQRKETEDAERAFKTETSERNRLWDAKLHEFHEGVVEHAANLKRQQIGVLQAFRQRMADKTPTKAQWSRDLLKHRKVQTTLAKQGKYLEADEVKKIADRMEHIELQATLAAYAAEVAAKEAALKSKQQNEMEVLLQRAAQGRDELRKTRAQDLEKCAQRHKHIVRELRISQKQEHLKFEQILGRRVSEFKKNGGSLEMLAETLSGMDSLALPGMPDCPEGDEAHPSSYHSD